MAAPDIEPSLFFGYEEVVFGRATGGRAGRRAKVERECMSCDARSLMEGNNLLSRLPLFFSLFFRFPSLPSSFICPPATPLPDPPQPVPFFGSTSVPFDAGIAGHSP